MRFEISKPPVDLGGLADAFKGDLSLISKMTVDVDVSGKEEIMKNVHLLATGMVQAAREEARRAAEWLKSRSEELVPYDTGNLHDSAFLHEDESSELDGFTVGYDAIGVQYAWYVHEIPAKQYTKPGTQWHYLSDPAEELKAEFPDQMRRGIRDAIKRSPAIQRSTPLGGPRLVKKH